jgi:hypothetical protein
MSELYYFRLLDHPEIQGPATLSSIEADTKGDRYRYEAVLADGQTYAQLQKTKNWVMVDSLLLSASAEAALPRITATTHCHVFYAGQKHGPYVPTQIQTMWGAGTLTADTSVLPAGYPDSIPISDFLARIQLGNATSDGDSSQSKNPDLFGFIVVLTIFFPIVGLIAGIRWLCDPKHRGAGGSILAIALILMLIYGMLLSF